MLTGSVVLAPANLALVPSLFFGTDAARFHAANGWGAVAGSGGLDVIWFAVLGRAVLRAGTPAAAGSRPVERVGSY